MAYNKGRKVQRRYINMATSSIFSNVKISDRKATESFINAVTVAEKHNSQVSECSVIPSMDKDQIRKAFAQKKK